MSNTMIIASMNFVGVIFLGYNLFLGNRETIISDTIIGVGLCKRKIIGTLTIE